MANCYNDCIHSFVCQYVNHDEYPSVQQLKDHCRYSTIGTDVVPKREYDAVVSVVDNSTKEFLKLHDAYQDAKREAEEYKHNWQKIHDSYNADCLEHYNKGRQDAAREIFEELRQKRNELWNKGNYTMFECWCKAEEELEKKYMEV